MEKALVEDGAKEGAGGKDDGDAGAEEAGDVAAGALTSKAPTNGF